MDIQIAKPEKTASTPKPRKKQPTGFVFYRGPSLIDGSPIVGVCLVGTSTNVKTGAMVQTYILRADVHPVEAVKTGSDVSICGECPHRLRARFWIDKKGRQRGGMKRTCYVNLGHGPTAVFSGLIRGIYPSVNPALLSKLKGRMLRLGTYGDPAAIPKAYWNMLLDSGISGHTGYTHQWQTSLGNVWLGKLMASVDNAQERLKAWENGWRTFAVLNTSETHKTAQSATCPSSKEYTEKTGKKVQCADCKLCNGAKANVAIQGHGIGWVDQPSQSQRISLV